jgi:hypothetical protein
MTTIAGGILLALAALVVLVFAVSLLGIFFGMIGAAIKGASQRRIQRIEAEQAERTRDKTPGIKSITYTISPSSKS